MKKRYDQMVEQIEKPRVATYAEFRGILQEDMRANRRNPKTQILLIGFRFCQYLRGNRKKPRQISLPFEALYRALTESLFGLELRPKTAVGAGLIIFHGFGLVVNDHTKIGKRVTLRNGVVIGNKIPNGPCPVIGNDVEIGANAVILGDVNIGDGATVGAGAVVTKDVEAGATVVGNPARMINLERHD